jgi:hypothetical protein
MARPAPVRRVSASANSPMTSALRKRCRPAPVPERPPSFSASAGSTRVAYHAGAQPNSSPASVDAASENRSTGRFRLRSASEGSVSWGMAATSARRATTPTPIPSTPPVSASSRFSVRNCAKMLRREAPSAARSATSFCRVVPLASSRLATFTHAISSTNPTAPSRIQSV